MDKTEKIVEITNLSKAYTQGHEQILVLEELDFSISKGEFISIVGPSGSGKSTFLNIVGLLDDVYSGEIRLFGRRLEDLGEAEKAVLRLKNIGFVFQFDSLLPEFTVLENIEMPARVLGGAAPGRGLELLKHFDLEVIAHKFPMEISGGEKQRAAMLRALRNGPALLIADEPTGNLDRHNSGVILDDLRRAADLGTAVLMVTHNEEAARRADRSLRMAGGRLETPK
ncbi:MAG: hypothetical protein A2X35_12495 [Elusimicrobia bacterium GWA2_61_42]|nr:MAG: hypothetical protein A2X35_12495 [Elusimicrobia bacterium GWA2_61_42]OGR75315.1 MAG: hypothetical protein A2X38_05940 [Elusimicrobia bacterium GWC2_61_25]